MLSKKPKSQVGLRQSLLLLAWALLAHVSVFAMGPTSTADPERLNQLSHAGTRWLIDYMRTADNLLGNENNYLTFLTGMAECARDKRLAQVARDEATRVAQEMLTPFDEFLKRFHNNAIGLAELLGFFHRLGVADPQHLNKLGSRVAQSHTEFQAIFSDLKDRAITSEELYDAMLLAYYLTVLKEQFPAERAFADLPDLGDFLEVLAHYRYAFEDQKVIDFKGLNEDAVLAINSDLYNVTHVYYVFADYRPLMGAEAFFQRELAYMEKMKPYIASKANRDIDLVAEIIEVLVAMGISRDDPFIKEQWARILRHPRQGGKWLPPWPPDPDEDHSDSVYNEMHTTWVITEILTAKDCEESVPFHRPLIGALEKYAALFDPTTGTMATKLRRADDEFRRLSDLVGVWKTTTRVWVDGPDEPPLEYRGSMDRRWVLDGQFLEEHTASSSDSHDFHGLAYIGYDQSTALYQYLQVNNIGTGMSIETGRYDPVAKVLRTTGAESDPKTGYIVLNTTEIEVVSPDRQKRVRYAMGVDGRRYKRVETSFVRTNP